MKPGEFVAVAGPSGSGKSTLLTCSGCSRRRTAGEIWLDDVVREPALAPRPVPGARPLDRLRLPVVPADRGSHRARERAARRALRGPRAADARWRTRARSWSGSGSRTGAATTRPSSRAGSSSGWPIAGRCSTPRRCVLADEPTGNLDEGHAAVILAELRALCRERGSLGHPGHAPGRRGRPRGPHPPSARGAARIRRRRGTA